MLINVIPFIIHIVNSPHSNRISMGVLVVISVKRTVAATTFSHIFAARNNTKFIDKSGAVLSSLPSHSSVYDENCTFNLLFSSCVSFSLFIIGFVRVFYVFFFYRTGTTAIN